MKIDEIEERLIGWDDMCGDMTDMLNGILAHIREALAADDAEANARMPLPRMLAFAANASIVARECTDLIAFLRCEIAKPEAELLGAQFVSDVEQMIAGIEFDAHYYSVTAEFLRAGAIGSDDEFCRQCIEFDRQFDPNEALREWTAPQSEA